MKLSKKEFKRLQKAWYDLLKDSGFKDIERGQGSDSALISSSEDCYRNYTGDMKHEKERYFILLSQAIEDENTVFRNKADKHILTRHADGAKRKTIVEELIRLGIPRTRMSVRIIIRRYEMAWNIKCYNDKQLNKKKYD